MTERIQQSQVSDNIRVYGECVLAVYATLMFTLRHTYNVVYVCVRAVHTHKRAGGGGGLMLSKLSDKNLTSNPVYAHTREHNPLTYTPAEQLTEGNNNKNIKRRGETEIWKGKYRVLRLFI